MRRVRGGGLWFALTVCTALCSVALCAPLAAAAPTCAGGPVAVQTLVSTGDVLEYGIFDRYGRFYYSDQTMGMLMRIDHFGEAAKVLAPIAAPGAVVFAGSGSLTIGSGDSFQDGSMGDSNPMSSLVRVNLETGATQTYATGLGMANGLAFDSGTYYATNDAGYDVDRVRRGKVLHPWASVYSTNGVVVSADDQYVYVTQTFSPAAIQRISIADPSHVTPYAVAEGADVTAGLDDMTMDRSGNLYVAANGAGQIWKVDTSGTICVLATGLVTPSAVNFGRGTSSRNLYVVGFDGHISELANVRPRGG
jgi:sugar lactone lactonase YvrE